MKIRRQRSNTTEPLLTQRLGQSTAQLREQSAPLQGQKQSSSQNQALLPASSLLRELWSYPTGQMLVKRRVVNQSSYGSELRGRSIWVRCKSARTFRSPLTSQKRLPRRPALAQRRPLQAPLHLYQRRSG